ncbi:unnamed protein product, partial [Brassica oleracea var. botrytis]
VEPSNALTIFQSEKDKIERELRRDKWLLFPQKDIGELLASTQMEKKPNNTLTFKISSIHLSSIINNYQYSKIEREKYEKVDKEAIHEDDDFGDVSTKANQTSQYQDWMEVNSKNKEKTMINHENNSNTSKLFYLSFFLNKNKVSTSYTYIRTVNGVLYPTFEDAYNAFFI